MEYSKENDLMDGMEMNEHTHSMRRALHHCLDKLQRLSPHISENRKVSPTAIAEAKRVELERAVALRQFWAERTAAATTSTATLHNNDHLSKSHHGGPKISSVDIVHLRVRTDARRNGTALYEYRVEPNDANDTHDGGTANEREIKRRYVHRNIPFLVRGFDADGFSRVSDLCTRKRSDRRGKEQSGSSLSKQAGRRIIDTEWFRTVVGEGTMVPVRIQPSHLQTADLVELTLDTDGRAAECTTLEITMQRWIEAMNGPPDPTMYLKDWHLQKLLEQNSPQSHDSDAMTNKIRTQHHRPLYTVPTLFTKDLLNSFLLSYTSGDYRFVYWGPEGSNTALHSDVLHSFSWSYNVVGHKKWTFYAPKEYGGASSLLEVMQKSGETIFVPSGWKHEVENLQETLSINHNWISAANLDLVWDCMRIELHAVQHELKAWDIHMTETNNNLYRAQEDVLRGCVGMDVTSFFFLVFTSLVDCMDDLELLPYEHNPTNNDNYGCADDENHDAIWEYTFDLCRLKTMLETLLTLLDTGAASSEIDSNQGGLLLRQGTTSCQLQNCLEAVLESRQLAMSAIAASKSLVDALHQNFFSLDYM